MKFENYTNFNSDTLKEYIRIAKPNNVSNFDVQIKNCGGIGVKGKAYWNGNSYHCSSDPFINVYIGRTETKYPRMTYSGKGYIGFKVYNQYEEIMFVIAHELRHLWQSRVRKGWRVWGARGQFSERDADAYGIKMLRKLRKMIREVNKNETK